MEQIVSLPQIKKRQMEHANQVRMWLRVITITELAALCGTETPPDRFNGKWRAKLMLSWPRQPPPTREMFDVFRVLIKRAFCNGDMKAQKAHAVLLDVKLGDWYQTTRHVQYNEYLCRNVACRRQEAPGPLLYSTDCQ